MNGVERDRVAPLLTRVRRRLLLRTGLRALAVALLAGAAASAFLVGVDAALTLPALARRALRWLPLAILVAPAVAVLRARARASHQRLALLVDEHVGQDHVGELPA